MDKKTRLVVIAVLAVGVVLMIALGLVSVFGIGLAGGTCTPVEGSSFIAVPSGIYQIENSDAKVFILRGIALGEPSVSDTDVNETIPACQSLEEGLHTLKNLSLIAADGTKYKMLKGIGNDGSAIEAVTVPLP